MKISLNNDSIGAWKAAMVGDSDATFIWIADSPSTPDRSDASDGSGTETAAPEGCCRFAWLADAHDTIIAGVKQSPGFLDYVKSIRSFAPNVITFEGLTETARLIEGMHKDAHALDVITSLKQDHTYLFANSVSEYLEKIAIATGIGIAGTPLGQIYATLDSKCEGRELCRRIGIRVPSGTECHTAEQLRAALHLETGLTYPLLAKAAGGWNGEGHRIIRSLADANHFLADLSSEHNTPSPAYVLETYLENDPDSNFSFRVVVGREGDITLTNIHRELIYPPAFNSIWNEYPHGLDERQTQIIYDAAETVGRAMHQLGFCGPAGCDGLIDRQGTSYPILDINPRLTGDVYSTVLVTTMNPSFFRAIVHNFSTTVRDATFGNIHAALRNFPIPSRTQDGTVFLWHTREPAGKAAFSSPCTLSFETITFASDHKKLVAISDDICQTLARHFSAATSSAAIDKPAEAALH